MVQAAPSPRKEDSSVHLSAPEDNPTCTSLPGLSDLCKLEDNHAHGVNNCQETAIQRPGADLKGSVGSGVLVSGEAENCSDRDSIEVVPSQTQDATYNTHVQRTPDPFADAQDTPIQPMLAQITPAPNTPAQLPPVNQILREAIHPPVFTPVHPNGTPAQPPGLPALFPPVTPGRQPLLLDPRDAQRKLPINPANLFASPNPFMVIPALSPPSKQTTPNTPTVPPLVHGRMSEAIGLAPDILRDQPLLPRSPRPRVQPNLDPVATAKGKEKPLGVIGDRRVLNHQLQPQAAEKPQNEPDAKVESAVGARDQVGAPSEPPDTYPEPIYVRKYFVGRYLGGGATGKVYSVLNKKSMTLHALKVIERGDFRFDDVSMVKQELNIMRAISEAKFFGSRNNGALLFVNHLVESWYDKDCIYFVMVRLAALVTNLVMIYV
jgi:hypothetical protein